MEGVSHVVVEVVAGSVLDPTRKNQEKCLENHSRTDFPALIVGGHRARFHPHWTHFHHRKHLLRSGPLRSVTGHREGVGEMKGTKIVSGRREAASLGFDSPDEGFSTDDPLHQAHYHHRAR